VLLPVIGLGFLPERSQISLSTGSQWRPENAKPLFYAGPENLGIQNHACLGAESQAQSADLPCFSRYVRVLLVPPLERMDRYEPNLVLAGTQRHEECPSCHPVPGQRSHSVASLSSQIINPGFHSSNPDDRKMVGMVGEITHPFDGDEDGGSDNDGD